MIHRLSVVLRWLSLYGEIGQDTVWVMVVVVVVVVFVVVVVVVVVEWQSTRQ